MPNSSKPIRLSNHCLMQLSYRGTTEEEIREAILNSAWGPAELGRLDCKKDFPYDREWNGKHYKTKQVRPIFAEEKTEIVIITVYVYYF